MAGQDPGAAYGDELNDSIALACCNTFGSRRDGSCLPESRKHAITYFTEAGDRFRICYRIRSGWMCALCRRRITKGSVNTRGAKQHLGAGRGSGLLGGPASWEYRMVNVSSALENCFPSGSEQDHTP